ncbi:MAG: threonylcarbamoyl-AMP synthase [Candidatus Portnoybacteria bacterium]|nr:threonylcarbamoyl-AMP synthase [Candidatus Portnoybacteria bacterium]
MDVIKINPENLRPSRYGIEKAAEIILRGGVVVIPTDTVYGLAADATKEYAVKKIFKIKKRPETKPVPLIVRDLEMAKKLAFVDKRLERILNLIWPGAITAILQKKFNLPEIVTAGKRTIGLRIPDYKLIHFLIEEIGRPLTATSANISSQPPSNKIEDVLSQFRNEFFRPDLVLDAGDLKCCEPSTVLDLSTDQPKIIRIGPASPKKLMEILSI